MYTSSSGRTRLSSWASCRADISAALLCSKDAVSVRSSGASWRERNTKPSLMTTAARSALSMIAQNASSTLPTNTGS
jgi:hypothetical protein